MQRLTIGSLFSGIGGLELGLEWAGLGPVLWQVEKDPYCLKVLEKHWPDVKRYEDVKEINGSITPVDFICGGFPCQDVSSAGTRAGLDGPRSGLWYDFARIVESIRPQWVIVENVASGARMWIDEVRGQLAEQGYETFPVPLGGFMVGAPYFRKRVFIIAHINRENESAVTQHEEVESTPKTSDINSQGFQNIQGGSPETQASRRRFFNHTSWRDVEPPMVRMVSRVSHRVDRIRTLGNSVVPQVAQVIGEIVKELAHA